MHIRLEIPADIPAIHALTQAAFLDAPHTQHTEHFIVDALRDAGQLSLSLVAHDEHDEHALIGHIAFSPVHLIHADAQGNAPTSNDTLPAGWYGLGPVSVLPSRQRQGIGSKLITHALATLRQASAAGCVVLGEPAYYQRFGFAVEPSLVLPGMPTEYFMAIKLNRRLKQMPQGVVRYHEAFDSRAPGGMESE